MIATHGDERGLVLPVRLAPVQVVIVPIVKDETKEKVMQRCREVQNAIGCCFFAKIDDTDRTPGFKFNEWEMKGVPIRIEIGMRDVESDSVVVVRRDTGEKLKVKTSEVDAKLDEVAKAIDKNLRKRADKWFSEQMISAESMDELGEKLARTGSCASRSAQRAWKARSARRSPRRSRWPISAARFSARARNPKARNASPAGLTRRYTCMRQGNTEPGRKPEVCPSGRF